MTTARFDIQPEPIKPHVLVVTEADGGELAYAVECPGVTSHCRLWKNCQPCSRRAFEIGWVDLDLDQSHQAHGEEHQWIDDADAWCVPTARCYLVEFDDIGDYADAVATAPGRYPVLVTFDEGRPLLELAR